MLIICILMVFFYAFPLVGEHGENPMGVERILHGFANSALLTVLALLVVGQGMVRTGVLEFGAQFVLKIGRGHMLLTFLMVLVIVTSSSAFLNNIPVVVIFIPIMQTMAAKMGRPASKLMMPLSFAAVLGGMTTLIGSGTNLLVTSAMIELNVTPFEFFEFTVPGIVMAVAGLAYILLIAPLLLPSREGSGEGGEAAGGRQFIAEIMVAHDSSLIGQKPLGGIFKGLPDITVRAIKRGYDDPMLPPFEDYEVASGDVLIVAATRKTLYEALTRNPGLLTEEVPDIIDQATGKQKPWKDGEHMLAEVMVTPASRMIGQTLNQIDFHFRTHCLVAGVQRRSRMIRSRMTDIRLAAGDVLLVQGHPKDVNALRAERDMVLIEWSAEEMPKQTHARRATSIFVLVVLAAASGLLPIVVAAMAGAVAMVLTGVMNLKQATQAVDSKVITTIVAALALGAAMQETGGAAYLAGLMLHALGDSGPAVALSAFFLLVAVLANLISAKTTAVLFTPIGIGIAKALGIDPVIFAVAVVFAANCAFATPIAYQTSLLVMGPGHYKFSDFIKAGTPLVFLLWLVFSFFAPWYYGI